MLEPQRERDQADEDRRRAEEERDGGGVRELHAVHEAQLVEEDHQRGEGDEPEVGARDPERPLTVVREGPEERDSDEVADRSVGERLPAVVEHELRHGDVERPEQHRPKQHRVNG